MILSVLLQGALLIVTSIIALGLIYHYVLLILGRPKRPSATAASQPITRFALIVPAHNEAEVIEASVQRLRLIDYPASQFDVHVVADHCTDETAAVARAAGAEVHKRDEGPRGRKGFALDWLIRRLLVDPRSYQAMVVFDADSRVDSQFLSAVGRHLAADAVVVQGRHIISNPDASQFARLADIDMRLNNRIRNQAKENLGLSARLMGDAMVFRREVLEQHPWMGAQSLAEDRDYGIYLVTQGVRIRFVPEACSYGQAAASWEDATPQRLRWYGGAFDLQRRYVPILWRLSMHGNPDALDKLLELVLPPFSMLVLGTVFLFLVQALLALGLDWPTAWPAVSGLLVLLAAAYPFLGLVLTDAPARSYAALLVGPLYAVWRVWIGVWVRLRYRRLSWVRTRRAADDHHSSQKS
jgi:cellulose synthase/poly-beta-1,6-N-acetylglucosamine synthase-like glycosyltransferase